jgi:RNA polymerase sigma factor (sigma-70 family)
MSDIDPGEHLRLLSRVVGQMHFQGDDVEEAWSEGLVAITEAAKSYDPGKGPVANWLARNIRWSLSTWRSNRRYTINMPVDLEYPREDAISKAQFNELLHLMRENLTVIEQKIMFMTAVGYNGKEIAIHLKLEEMAVSRAKRKAREKLKKFYE